MILDYVINAQDVQIVYNAINVIIALNAFHVEIVTIVEINI